jgi:hypothetical protein
MPAVAVFGGLNFWANSKCLNPGESSAELEPGWIAGPKTRLAGKTGGSKTASNRSCPSSAAQGVDSLSTRCFHHRGSGATNDRDRSAIDTPQNGYTVLIDRRQRHPGGGSPSHPAAGRILRSLRPSIPVRALESSTTTVPCPDQRGHHRPRHARHERFAFCPRVEKDPASPAGLGGQRPRRGGGRVRGADVHISC